MKKQIFFLGLILALTILFIPTLLVTVASQSTIEAESSHPVPAPAQSLPQENAPDIHVYLSKEKRVEVVPFEMYIRGVVASEMPVTFQLEALKAQALAARTYIVKRLLDGRYSDMKKWGTPAKGAMVSDTVEHQVYTSDAVLRARWGRAYEQNLAKVQLAVDATRGQIITYAGKPIYAAFFSTSNGRTENSEDYFKQKYPYLRSVDSSWDKNSPKYERVQSMTIADFLHRLSVYNKTTIAVSTTIAKLPLHIIKWTVGGRVAEITVGDKEFSGRQVREALQLASSDFTWQIQGKMILFTTKGYGHGVGMSQWGADLLAQQGKTALYIVQHYYQGVEVQPFTFPANLKK